jgi:hypothetical protein
MTKMTFVRVPQRTIPSMLQGRPLDPRVTYTTGFKRSKEYPAVGKRQRERAARKEARIDATVNPNDHDHTI